MVVIVKGTTILQTGSYYHSKGDLIGLQTGSYYHSKGGLTVLQTGSYLLKGSYIITDYHSGCHSKRDLIVSQTGSYLLSKFIFGQQICTWLCT